MNLARMTPLSITSCRCPIPRPSPFPHICQVLLDVRSRRNQNQDQAPNDESSSDGGDEEDAETTGGEFSMHDPMLRFKEAMKAHE